MKKRGGNRVPIVHLDQMRNDSRKARFGYRKRKGTNQIDIPKKRFIVSRNFSFFNDRVLKVYKKIAESLIA
jgi:hypothetical protein